MRTRSSEVHPAQGKSHLAQAIGQAVITQGYRIYGKAHILLEEIADAALDGKRKEHVELLATVPQLIIDALGMRKLGPHSGRRAAGDRHAPLRTRPHVANLQPLMRSSA